MRKRINKIYTQGYFDGACFIYSIANCYYALTGKKVSRPAWNKAIKNVPFIQNFMGDEGTGGIENNILMCILENFLSSLTSTQDFVIKKEQKCNLSNAITKESVTIFAILGNTDNQQNLDHWVCGVATLNKSIMIACSWIGYDNVQYRESRDLTTGRWYNDGIQVGPAIVGDCIYSITLKDKGIKYLETHIN